MRINALQVSTPNRSRARWARQVERVGVVGRVGEVATGFTGFTGSDALSEHRNVQRLADIRVQVACGK